MLLASLRHNNPTGNRHYLDCDAVTSSVQLGNQKSASGHSPNDVGSFDPCKRSVGSVQAGGGTKDGMPARIQRPDRRSSASALGNAQHAVRAELELRERTDA